MSLQIPSTVSNKYSNNSRQVQYTRDVFALKRIDVQSYSVRSPAARINPPLSSPVTASVDSSLNRRSSIAIHFRKLTVPESSEKPCHVAKERFQ